MNIKEYLIFFLKINELKKIKDDQQYSDVIFCWHQFFKTLYHFLFNKIILNVDIAFVPFTFKKLFFPIVYKE